MRPAPDPFCRGGAEYRFLSCLAGAWHWRWCRRRVACRLLGKPGLWRGDRIERVRQRDIRHRARILVAHDLRIDKEAYRHLQGLARLQQLLLEAEAFELVEEDGGLLGQDVEGGGAAQRSI